jgi:hypothetical protein
MISGPGGWLGWKCGSWFRPGRADTRAAPEAARPPHPPAGEPGDGPQVAFARSGLTVPWDDGFASLLELAEACDVPVRSHRLVPHV